MSSQPDESISTRYSKELHFIIGKMLEKDARRRPSPDAILKYSAVQLRIERAASQAHESELRQAAQLASDQLSAAQLQAALLEEEFQRATAHSALLEQRLEEAGRRLAEVTRRFAEEVAHLSSALEQERQARARAEAALEASRLLPAAPVHGDHAAAAAAATPARRACADAWMAAPTNRQQAHRRASCSPHRGPVCRASGDSLFLSPPASPPLAVGAAASVVGGCTPLPASTGSGAAGGLSLADGMLRAALRTPQRALLGPPKRVACPAPDADEGASPAGQGAATAAAALAARDWHGGDSHWSPGPDDWVAPGPPSGAAGPRCCERADLLGGLRSGPGTWEPSQEADGPVALGAARISLEDAAARLPPSVPGRTRPPARGAQDGEREAATACCADSSLVPTYGSSAAAACAGERRYDHPATACCAEPPSVLISGSSSAFSSHSGGRGQPGEAGSCSLPLWPPSVHSDPTSADLKRRDWPLVEDAVEAAFDWVLPSLAGSLQPSPRKVVLAGSPWPASPLEPGSAQRVDLFGADGQRGPEPAGDVPAALPAWPSDSDAAWEVRVRAGACQCVAARPAEASEAGWDSLAPSRRRLSFSR